MLRHAPQHTNINLEKNKYSPLVSYLSLAIYHSSAPLQSQASEKLSLLTISVSSPWLMPPSTAVWENLNSMEDEYGMGSVISVW